MRKLRTICTAPYALGAALLLLTGTFSGCATPERGAKVFQSDVPLKQADAAKVSFLFVRPELAAQEGFLKEAHARGLQVFVTFGVLFNPEYSAKHPEALAITDTGKIARDQWLEIICPSNQAYKEAFKRQLKEFVTSYHPDGITLDFCRHFVYWEGLRKESNLATLPRSCFCPECLKHFERTYGISLPSQEPVKWIQENAAAQYNRFRMDQITNLAAELRVTLRLAAPGIPVVFHTVPFVEGSDRDLSEVTGQKLSELDHLGFTAFSPMLYRELLHESDDWAQHQLDASTLAAPQTALWPCIQAGSVYGETQTSQEFSNDLAICERHQATSRVLVFTLERLNALPEHLNAFRR